MPGVIVLTASADSFPGLAEQLRLLPAIVEERPLMRFAPPEDWAEVDAALARIAAASAAGNSDESYAVVVFTSPRAVRAIADRLHVRGFAWPQVSPPEIWVAGDGTAAILHQYLGKDLAVSMPTAQDTGRVGAAAALATAMLAAGVSGPVFFPCGDRRRDELPDRLRARGVRVDDVICYRSVVATDAEARAATADADVVIVASPTVAHLLARAYSSPKRPALLAVGPMTAAASAAAGWPPAAVADSPTTEAIGAAARSLLG